jgi:FMN phosphatase YigB (HAD superfamily)
MLPMRPAMVRSKASWEYVATHLELACELRSALAGRIAHSTGSQPPAYLRQTQKGVAIDCVFFGIGSTLGTVRRPPLSLTHHAEIPRLLQSLRALGLRIGIISNVPAEVSRGEIVAMLEAAGLYDAFDEGLVVLSSDRAKTEPEHQIYRDALERAGVAAEECLFIGDNPAEVIGAQAAGMSAHLRALPAASLAPL